MLSYGRKKSEASLLVAREVEEAVEGPLEMVTKVDVEFTLTLSAPRDVLSDARKILLLNNPSGELPFLIPFKETEASLHFKCLAHCALKVETSVERSAWVWTHLCSWRQILGALTSEAVSEFEESTSLESCHFFFSM